MAKQKKNYLDFVPVISDRNTWSEENGKVTVHMVNKGFYHMIAQKFFHTPRVSHIALDEYGSFVWSLIDGKRTVGQIADSLKEKYGKKAEPLYERLARFFQILEGCHFICFK